MLLPPIKNYAVFCLSVILLFCIGSYSVQAASGPVISTGAEHACAVLSDNSIRCWGNNLDGQSSPPGGSFSQVSSGDFYTCGLRTDGKIECWGFLQLSSINTYTQVSAGANHLCALRTDSTVFCDDAEDVPAPAALPPNGEFKQVSAGTDHSCGVRVNGTVSCWGDNASGETDAPGDTFVAVSAGDNHTCGIRPNGLLECWGANDDGEASPPDGSFKQVSAGGEHSCGVRTDGTLACWGDNAEGQASPPGGIFVQVSTADRFSCGVRTNGQMDCWGRDDTGRLTPPFQGSPIEQLTSGDSHNCGLRADGAVQCSGADGFGQASPPGGQFTQIEGGGFHTCSIRPDSTVTCWGSNLDGQSDAPGGAFSQISAGTWHSCGINNSGLINCWGYDGNGQASPPTNSTFRSISAGQNHTCAIRTDNTVACWGLDSDGQSSPPGGTFSQVAAGRFHTCGIHSNGVAECWGSNNDGEASPPPFTFIDIAAGARHTCGLRTDGSLACWGDNSSAQSNPPAGQFKAITAGFTHSCGLRTDGSAICWGSNGSGYIFVPEGLSGKASLFQAPPLNISATRLLNISTLGFTFNRGLEAGFIVQGGNQRFVLMGENYGEMANPRLRLLNLATGQVLEQNERWREHPTAGEVETTLRAPGSDNDAAFAITLPQGLYVAELTDAGGQGGTGLVSVTATDENQFQQTYPLNISTRGPSPMAAGFIAFGTESRCYVIKAEGLTLGGGSSTVSDPALAVYSYDSASAEFALIDASDNWQDHPSANLIAQAFAPVDGKEAALALRLPQGIYFAELYSTRSSEEGQDSIISITELPENLLNQGNCDLTRTATVAPVLDDGPPTMNDPNPPPPKQSLTAFVSQPQNGGSFSMGQSIEFKATAKAEPENAQINYQWDFGSNASVTMTSERTAVVRYFSAGSKVITLQASANGLTETTTVTVTIRERESGGK